MKVSYSGRELLKFSLRELVGVTDLLRYPKNTLKNTFVETVKKLLNDIEDFDFYFTVSGRAALYLLGKEVLKKTPHRNIALIPDYICNVVEIALNKSGWKIQTYRTNTDFSIDEVDLVKKLNSFKQNAGIVLIASIFGAQNGKCDILENIRSILPGIHIVFDEAQNLSTKSKNCYSQADSIIFSFNKKNIPGYMGGILLTKGISIRLNNSGIDLEGQIAALFIKNKIREISNYSHGIKKRDLQYEFSFCKGRIFYEVDLDMEISKLSLATALYHLRRLKNIEAIRRQNYSGLKRVFEWFSKTKKIKVIDTENVSISPFIPIYVRNIDKMLDVFNIPIKNPYSKFHDPFESLRPNLWGLINFPVRMVIHQ